MDYLRRYDIANKITRYYKRPNYKKPVSRELMPKQTSIQTKSVNYNKFWLNIEKHISLGLGSLVVLCSVALYQKYNNNPTKEPFQPNILRSYYEYFKQTHKSIKIEDPHVKTVSKLADSWAKTYDVPNKNGEFNNFVEKVYNIAEELNITETNSGTWDNSKYLTKQDQVIDEMLAAFANESKFDPKARSADGTFHGIFQFSNIAMKELVQRKIPIANVTMQEFENLSPIRQLDYMYHYTAVCKEYYSKLADKPISPKQVHSMWQYPTLGNPNHRIKDKDGNVTTGAQLQQTKANVCKYKQAERNKAMQQ